MSLSDKLNQARRERLFAAGQDPGPARRPKPVVEPVTEPQTAAAFDPITIEVGPIPGQLVATAGTIELTDSSSDTTCPNCHAPGVVDLVDLVGHARHCSCRSCGAMWQIRDEVAVGFPEDATVDH